MGSELVRPGGFFGSNSQQDHLRGEHFNFVNGMMFEGTQISRAWKYLDGLLRMCRCCLSLVGNAHSTIARQGYTPMDSLRKAM